MILIHCVNLLVLFLSMQWLASLHPSFMKSLLARLHAKQKHSAHQNSKSKLIDIISAGVSPVASLAEDLMLQTVFKLFSRPRSILVTGSRNCYFMYFFCASEMCGSVYTYKYIFFFLFNTIFVNGERKNWNYTQHHLLTIRLTIKKLCNCIG